MHLGSNWDPFAGSNWDPFVVSNWDPCVGSNWDPCVGSNWDPLWPPSNCSLRPRCMASIGVLSVGFCCLKP
eukprot:6467478-Alexandrium_andersonii.AAC.1